MNRGLVKYNTPFLLAGLFLVLLYLFCNPPVDTDANVGPSCYDTSLTVEEIIPLKVSLNVSDPDNDYLDWSIVDPPRRGRASKPFGTIGSGEEFTYTSNNFMSDTRDTFTIQVTDFMEYDTMCVVVAISADNDPPEAVDGDSIRVLRGRDFPIHIKGTDPEGLPVTWEIVTDPSNGVLKKERDTISDSTEATYKSDTSYDSFEYRVSDGQLYSPTATAYITNCLTKVLQQGLNGYNGCEDVSIGHFIKRKPDTTIEKDASKPIDCDTLHFLNEC